MTKTTVREIRDDIMAGRAFKRYIITGEAWYASSATIGWQRDKITGEMSIGVDSRDGGTYGEWIINWRKLGGLAVRLEIFDDGWTAFRASGFADIMAQFEGVDYFTLADFAVALDAHGWKDSTLRRRGVAGAALERQKPTPERDSGVPK